MVFTIGQRETLWSKISRAILILDLAASLPQGKRETNVTHVVLMVGLGEAARNGHNCGRPFYSLNAGCWCLVRFLPQEGRRYLIGIRSGID